MPKLSGQISLPQGPRQGTFLVLVGFESTENTVIISSALHQFFSLRKKTLKFYPNMETVLNLPVISEGICVVETE